MIPDFFRPSLLVQRVRLRLSNATLSSTVFAVLIMGISPGSAAAEDWLQWGGPRGDFTVESGALAEKWPEDGPRRLWKQPLGEGHSSILYRDGKLFTLYRTAQEEITVALDAGTGKALWEHRETPKLWPDMTDAFGLGPNSTPLLMGNRLVTVSIAGMARGLDSETGKPLWQVDLEKRFGRRKRVEEYGYSGNPLPYDGKAIALVGGHQHAVVAFDPRDGSVAWASEPGGVSYAQPTITRLAGRDQYVYFSPQGVRALDPATGETLWRAPIEFNNGNHLTPVVPCDEQHLWVGSQFSSGGGRLLQITDHGETLNAKKLWFDTKLQASHWTLIRRGEFVYGSIGGNRTSFLAAFHCKSGKIAWRQRGHHKALSLWADGKLLFLDEDGQLALAEVSPEGVEILASTPVTGSPQWTLPTLVETTLYLRDQEHLMALDLGKAAP